MKIWQLFYTLWQENKRRKKVFSLKCIQKSNVTKKRIWVLVFGFMYLVLVDAMDQSKVSENGKAFERNEDRVTGFLKMNEL